MVRFRRHPDESASESFRRWFLHWLPVFYANWIAALGSLMALVAVALLFAALFIHIYQIAADRPSNPYMDLVGFMVLPAVLVAGFALVLIGNLVRRRREHRTGPEPVAVEVGGDVLARRVAQFVLLGGAAVIIFVSFSYEAYHYTDSTDFCLKVCHQVMEPEGVAYQRSPHSNVSCVECHIGPGAGWFVRSKISGVRQVFAVLGDTYSRPIPSPVENLRPARETCEVCHAPDKFHGSKLNIAVHVEPDRDNSPTVSAQLVKVGGSAHPGAPATGVHWHVDPRNEVRYRAADRKRMDIVEVVQRTTAGEVRYLRDGAEQDGEGEWRVMDCIDCHNRPTHVFEKPAEALDASFATGALDARVPWLRRESEKVLRGAVPGPGAVRMIAARLDSIYAAEHPDDLPALRAALPATAAELAAVLERNVFPRMNIDWGTYPDHLSHHDLDGELTSGGCFRCHDDELATAAGDVVRQDCDLCHALIAERESAADLPDFLGDLLVSPR